MQDIGHLAPFDREQLYEDVWSTPMKHLGTKYGLSGSDIRRVCNDLQIPVPEQGHWTRVEMGYAIERPPLPQWIERPKPTDIPRKRARRPRTTEQPTHPQPLPEAPSQKASLSAVARTPTRWHDAIEGLRKRMKDDADNAGRLKLKDDWERAHPGKRPPAHLDSRGNWEYFCDAGQLLATTHRKSVARLSLLSYERGLALLNIICWQAERSGYSVSMEKGDSRLRLTREQAYVQLRIVEKLDAGLRQRIRSWDRKTEQVKRLTPSGLLTLFVEQQGLGETGIADHRDQLLELQLERIFDVIELRYRRSVAAVAEWAQRDLDWKAAELRRQEEERQRKEAQQRAEQERQRKAELVAEAKSWGEAAVLRSYLDMLDARLGNGGKAMEGYAVWREWAQTVIDELDRSATRVEAESTHPNPSTGGSRLE
ncbi:hypothetical protein DR64_3953 [Paraburkholderia xenovorans LB400]|uniref:Uncharacterized protein n=2 Tax=Paraburkholderia xenovorans TaxID=36873 RepID=Q13XL9_PARXL|nr:hypothetical protein Bxe_A1789 [Paraburkholderia xenovorans LB400]AIP33098.1 hypothetical protein DR64_3953 [Paraburkholderia xenovorans LB400]